MDLTTFNSDVATMSSREIAELTGKEHKNVLVDIRKVLEEAEIGELKFQRSYLSDQNKELPCYHLPRRECDLVVSGYSVKYRLAIIDRWRELEAKQFPKDYISALEAFVESQKEKERLAVENAKLNTLIDNEFGYCSILRAACFLEVHETTFNWRVLKSHTTLLGLTIKRAPSPRFGYQNLYPLRAFRECYPQFDFDDLTPEKIDDKTSLALTQATKAIKAAK